MKNAPWSWVKFEVRCQKLQCEIISPLRTGENPMSQKAFQDYYPDDFSYCYGCGRLNTHGLQIKSYWDGEETVATFVPKPYHMALPGYVYGGLIASLIDCHSTGSAAAAAYRAQGRDMSSEPALRFVTASLHVDYLKPTPLGVTLEIRGRILEVKDRKVTVSSTLSAEGEICARGEVIAVQMPEHMIPGGQRK
jgi:acyl-coenzyme A thioesterase PaaI-like protein